MCIEFTHFSEIIQETENELEKTTARKFLESVTEYDSLDDNSKEGGSASEESVHESSYESSYGSSCEPSYESASKESSELHS